jgi:hypothetical protein
MNWQRLETILATHYADRDAAHRAPYAVRLHAVALRLAAADGDTASELDRDRLRALSQVVPVREAFRSTAGRATLEAWCTEAGWTPLATRTFLRAALEQLPDKPQSLDEKYLADAESLLRLGMHGFAAELAGCSDLEKALAAMHKSLARRFHTRAGNVEAGKLREELRELHARLVRALEPSS